jgi:hypothetical protein
MNQTIDARTFEACDPDLEDLAPLHLDLLAMKKGFFRCLHPQESPISCNFNGVGYGP